MARIDEWGRFGSLGIDEEGQSYFDFLNEYGESLFVASGSVIIIDTANQGSIAGDFIIAGSSAVTTDTAHSGVIDVVYPGGTTSTTDTAEETTNRTVYGTSGSTIEVASEGLVNAPTLGDQASTSDTANAGTVYMIGLIEGNAVALNDIAKRGKSTGGVLFVRMKARSTGGLAYATV